MTEKIIHIIDYKKRKALKAYKNLPPALKEHILHDYRNFHNIIDQDMADIPDGITFSDMQQAVKEAGLSNIENTGILQHIYPIKDKNYFSPYDRRIYEEKIERLPGKILEMLSDGNASVKLDSSRLNLIVESSRLTTSQIDKAVRHCFGDMDMDCPEVILNPG